MSEEVRAQIQKSLGDDYSIDREIGGGGMSRVFAATDVALGRPVVIKILAPELGAAVNLERFRREIQFAARLQHAYIVPVLSAGVADGLPYYMMPLVDGETLRSSLQRSGAMPVAEVLRILRDTAEALCYAHEHGIVHRDIKPENILIAGSHAHVTDFGVAKAISDATDALGGLTSVGIALGTPAYMAPEQAAGDPATDLRADLYALGAVGYEMLTGAAVFSARSAQAMLAAHAVEKPEDIRIRRPSVPGALAALVMKCLEKHPADRPQTAREFLGALEMVNLSGAVNSFSAQGSVLRGFPRWAWTAAAAVAIAAAGAMVLMRPGEAAAGQIRLVVLPFENLGAAADQYFADGVSEEVTNRLVRVAGLSVIARSSAAQLRKEGKDARAIGKQLGVDYVLDGTVRWAKSGDGSSVVRVTPTLVNVADGTQVWGEPYQGRIAQVFELQSNIAEKVAEALRGKLLSSDITALQRASTTNVEAFNAYMLGRFEWKKRSPAAIERAAAFFEEALRLDPSFARAYAGLADAYGLFPTYRIKVLSQADAYAKARAAAEKSIALDPNLAEGHAALSQVLFNADWDWKGVNRHLDRAIELDPGYATAHTWRAELMMTIVRMDEALKSADMALKLEPLSVLAINHRSFILAFTGKMDEAQAAARQAIAIEPAFPIAHMNLASQALILKRFDESISEFAAAGLPRDLLEPVIGAMRNPEKKNAALKVLGDDANRRRLSRMISANFYMNIGEPDLAFAELRRAVSEHDAFVVFAPGNPAFNALHSNPQWARFLESMKLSKRQLEGAGLM